MGSPRILLPLLGMLALVVSFAAGQDSSLARFTFLKVFPGSSPEYTELTVSEDNEATYEGRALADSPQPMNFRLPPELVAGIFSRAAELNYFQGIQLDAGSKIANLGQKTFRYVKGNKRGQVQFNYTQNQAASSLLELCEKIARGRHYISQLEFKLKYDRLGVLSTLGEFEHQFNNGGLVSFEQFAPILTQIAQDARLVRLAQIRAQRLLERIRGAPAQIRFEHANEMTGWYAAINLREDGPATYELRRLDQPSLPQPLVLSAKLHARVFELLREANYLRAESGYRDASQFTGGIRLTYEAGAEYNQLTFVTPPTPGVAALAQLFHQILNQIEFRRRLARALDQELLELPLVLRDLEQAINQQALAEPAEFVASLERVARGQNFYEEEQVLARKILGKIRATP